jgi:two-component system, cell cycle sensor histidine kinase and response regulator CckA
MRLGNLSIKGKLTAATFLTTGAALLLVGIVFAAYEVQGYRQMLVRQLATQAEIIGFNCMPALVFRDEKSAAETLAALRAEPQVAFAGIYTPDGRPFATYVRPDLPGSAAAIARGRAPASGLQFLGDQIDLTRPVGPANRPLGSVRLRADLTALRERMIQYLGITGVVLLVSLLAAVGIGSALQKTVSEPVLDLVATARTVTLEKNYGVRATARHRDELGTLVEAFNGMLDQIQRRDADLVQTDEALRASEERYRLLFENNPQPMWVFDGKTLGFLAVNGAACRHYHYSHEEFLGMTIRDIRPAEDVASLVEYLDKEPGGPQDSGVWRHRKKDGTVIEVEIVSHPVVFDGHDAQLVLSVDVTERRLLEQQLRQSQKMEAVGQLAGGVAHDFNNLLTAILGYADLLATRPGMDRAALGEIEEIRKAGDRAAGLTRQLLAFSRRQVMEPVVLRVNDLVENLEKMLRRLIGEDLDLVTRLDPSVSNVRADPGQLEQVVMNLAVNARDAMPRGGKLTIETSDVDLDEAYAQRHAPVKPGRFVMIAVNDTGEGMDAATQARIFEPFFTTKEKEKGTGLGLSTVYGIVKQSGGYIWVYSELGKGTTFKVYLPRVEDIASARQPRPVSESRVGTETMLLVEDDPAVRKLSRRILERAGYKVLEAESGREALELARHANGGIPLVVTDLVMPDMSGTELAAELAALYPEIRVLFMSGYTDDAVVRHGLLAVGRAFIQKPFTPDALTRKVRETLDTLAEEPTPSPPGRGTG